MADAFGQRDWHGVSNLAILTGDVSAEGVCIREGLDACVFAHAEWAQFARMAAF